MTELDDKLVPAVKRILLRVGATATLTEGPTGTDYDPATGGVVDTPDSHTVRITPPAPFDEEAMQGTSQAGEDDVIRKGDMSTLLSAALLTEATPPIPDPEPGWKLLLRSKTWQVLVVAPIMSGDEVCAWTLKLGR